MDPLGYITTAIAGYLLGSIPTGFLVAKAKGIDIRTVGSGNIGATNAFRVLGKPAGTFVLAVDALKGWFSAGTLAALSLDFFASNGANAAAAKELLMITGGLAAIAGHNYPCWLRFKGGKGIATSAGVFIALAPKACLVAFAVWIVVFALSRYVSLGSIAAAVALPIGAWATGGSTTITGVSAAVGALAIFKHKANIQRLRAGTESRFGAKKPDPNEGKTDEPPKE